MDIETGKRCAKCAIVKSLSEFSIRSQKGRKYPLSYCKPCKAERERKIRNLDLMLYREYKRDYYKKNIDACRETMRNSRRRNIINCRLKTNEWRRQNSIAVKLYRKQYLQNNKYKFNSYMAIRRAIKIKALPKWADKNEIMEIYRAAKMMKMDVDHIVPLVSKRVCGLHVGQNLQIITTAENCSKGNRIWPDMP